MGVPIWHRHPKKSSWPLPFGFVFLVWSVFAWQSSFACTSIRQRMGRAVHETAAPLPSLLLCFGDWARDIQSFDHPLNWVVFAPIPLRRTLKKGHGGGSEEEETVGICRRGQAPTPRRSPPIVYTRSSASDEERCPHNCGHLGSKPVCLQPLEEGAATNRSRVGVDTMDNGF